MPGNRVRPWLRPPDRLGGGGGSLPSRIRHLAPGQAILGRARPVEKIEILARQRPLFLGVSSGIGLQPHDDGCELRDAGGQILPSPRRRSRRIDFVEDVAMRCVERISAAPRFRATAAGVIRICPACCRCRPLPRTSLARAAR